MEPRRLAPAQPRRLDPAPPAAPPPRRAKRRTIMQHGRAKAYRPLPPEARRAALRAGLAAYRRGDFFLAHELLEPAWMGSADLAERDLYQGLIKLAAGYVHLVRGNPTGARKNLAGSRELLAAALGADGVAGLQVLPLVQAIDRRLERLARPVPPRRGLGPPPIRGRV